MGKQKGFVLFSFAIILLLVAGGIVFSLAFLLSTQQKILRNSLRSAQAFYAAEAGIEDALLRLKNGMQLSDNYSISINEDVSADVAINSFVGSSKTIDSQSGIFQVTRKVQAVYEIDADGLSFPYGAQVGEGGIVTENQSSVEGNVYSNGDVVGSGQSSILGDVIVAGEDNEIENQEVQGNVWADSCEESNISGTLYANDTEDCESSIQEPLGTPSDILPLPIYQSQIDSWKEEAEAGGASGSLTITGNQSLGPRKISGNLTIDGSGSLSLSGTVWVTGNVDLKNNGILKLADSYGSTGGVLLADGVITLQNNGIARGSGQAGSYLLLLSTKAGVVSSPAIIAKNNAQADILYAQNGFTSLENNIVLREVSGYGINLKNNAILRYESGLANTLFTSNPGGGWMVKNWKEVE